MPASHLSGGISAAQALQVFKDLNSREPQLRLLYVTPEKIMCSQQLKDCFRNLNNRDMLNRYSGDWEERGAAIVFRKSDSSHVLNHSHHGLNLID